ncbi:MAG: ribbon-helix-helix protein, CopG family [Candidatus Nealsonbacteria bacterium]|nr:ribbon-helix-helix protein, CopG family [Candidatus Nealsonbacteria bacterium]
MPASKVAISIDSVLLAEVDGLVEREEFASRSQAIQAAVREKLARMRRSRLAEECAKLDPSFEKAMAEEGMSRKLAKSHPKN